MATNRSMNSGLADEHLGELVDHEEQRRQRREVLARDPGLLVVADRGEVAGLAEQLLAAHHLAGQRVLHAVDQGELLREVGDHRGDVRHVGHAGEGGAALEVDEHHVELLGGVGEREPEDQGAQELRLAGAGRADHQAVRAHPLLGGLLDVEVHQGAALAEPDRHPQPVAGGAGAPGRRGLEAPDVAEPEQVHEVGRPGDLAAGRRLGAAAGGDGVQRGEPAGEGLGRREVALVGLGEDGVLAQPDGVHGTAAVGVGVLVEQLDAQPGGVVELEPPGRQVEHRDAVQPVGRHHVVARGQLDAVGDEQDVRAGRPLVGAEARALAEVGGQQRGEVGEGGAHHPHRADGVGLLLALGVRQPLHPVPVGEVVLGGQHREDEVVGGVEGRRRADHRPRQRARLLGVAADLDPVEGLQVDRGREVGLQPVHDQQPVQRGRRRRVDVVDRRALGRHQLEGQRLGAQAVADLEEQGVGGPDLPDPRPLLGERRQRGRVGVVPGERAALLARGLAGHGADVGEVAEVLGAGAGDLLVALLPLPVDLDDDEAERGEEEHARGDEAAAAATGAAHGGDQHDRAEAAEHRDGVHHHAGGALVGLDGGRRLEDQLPARHLRLLLPAATQGGAHVIGPQWCGEWSGATDGLVGGDDPIARSDDDRCHLPHRLLCRGDRLGDRAGGQPGPQRARPPRRGRPAGPRRCLGGRCRPRVRRPGAAPGTPAALHAQRRAAAAGRRAR